MRLYMVYHLRARKVIKRGLSLKYATNLSVAFPGTVVMEDDGG